MENGNGNLNEETPEFERLFFDPKGLPDGMTNQRYDQLMWNKQKDGDKVSDFIEVGLTETEIKSGWHFCGSWDYLLIHPEMMEEYGVCHCGHRTEKPTTEVRNV